MEMCGGRSSYRHLRREGKTASGWGSQTPPEMSLLIFASLASSLTLGVGPTAGNSHPPPQ